jgi:hypothetical protein
MLHETVPLQVFTPSFLLEDFYAGLSLDFFYLLGCLFLGLPHHIFFVAVVSQLAATTPSRQPIALILFLPSPARAVTCLKGRCIVDESTLGLAKSLKGSFLISALRSAWSVLLQNVGDF